MFSFFSKKIVGIDIHDYSAELVEVSIKGDKTYLEAYNRAIFPAGVIVDGEITKPDELKLILSSLFKNANPRPIETRNLAITFPSSKVMIHIFSFPANLSETEIKAAIPYEAETVIPFSMNDIYWDFTILEKEQDTTKKHLSQYVLFACINKQIADKYLEFFESIETTPELFSVTPDSLRYSLPKDLLLGKTSLIINVDTLAVDYLILKNLTIKRFFSTNESGYKLVKTLSKELQLGDDEIIERKEKNAFSALPKIDKIQKFMDKNYKRAQKIIAEYETAEEENKIDQIFLTGKFLNLPEFKTLATNFFPNQKVEIGDPTISLIIEPTKFKMENKTDDYSPYSIYFNNAIGSAVRALSAYSNTGVNLLPDRLRESFSTRKNTLILAFASITMTILTLVIGTFLTYQLINSNYKAMNLAASKSAIEKMIYGTRYQEIRDQIIAFNKEVSDLSRIDNSLFSIPAITKSIYNLMPNGVNITSFKFTNSTLLFDIAGIAENREALLEAENNLKTAQFIEKVDAPISNYDEKIRIPFQISIKLSFTKLPKYGSSSNTK